MVVVQVVTVGFWCFVVVGVLVRVVRRPAQDGRRPRRAAVGPIGGAGAVESELYGFPTGVPPASEAAPTSSSLVDDTPRSFARDLRTPRE